MAGGAAEVEFIYDQRGGNYTVRSEHRRGARKLVCDDAGEVCITAGFETRLHRCKAEPGRHRPSGKTVVEFIVGFTLSRASLWRSERIGPCTRSCNRGISQPGKRECARGDNVVLHDINLKIATGEHVAILGPNGCGKSTLIKTIACECYPS